MAEGNGSDTVERQIKVSKEHMQEVFNFLSANPAYMFQIPAACATLTKLHLRDLDTSRIVIHEDIGPEVRAHTIKHNYQNLLSMEALYRPWQLIWPLVALDFIRQKMKTLEVLSIGPRSEAEILSLYGVGFLPDKVTAIDLISYSDAIDIGDMHALPYADDSFDVIIMGWVLAYSSDNQKAVNEALRVARPGCHFAVGCVAEVMLPEYEKKAKRAVGGISITSPDVRFGEKTVSRYFNSAQILKLFGDRIAEVNFRCDPHPAMLDQRTNAIVVFRINP